MKLADQVSQADFMRKLSGLCCWRSAVTILICKPDIFRVLSQNKDCWIKEKPNQNVNNPSQKNSIIKWNPCGGELQLRVFLVFPIPC